MRIFEDPQRSLQDFHQGSRERVRDRERPGPSENQAIESEAVNALF